MILSPISQIGRHHKVTNITISSTSLSPYFNDVGTYDDQISGPKAAFKLSNAPNIEPTWTLFGPDMHRTWSLHVSNIAPTWTHDGPNTDLA